MQLTAKAEPVRDTRASDSSASDYVGKHRPHRMSLLRPRVRVSKLSDRVPASK